MRPVERGLWPLKANGEQKTFSSYDRARRDLIDRMGQYCSYCGGRYNTSLAVEHIQPKDLVPELELSWDNFLLACTNCNSTKGAKEVKMEDYFWPHIHNSLIPYKYKHDGKVELSDGLDADEKNKAQAMLDLVGLQKYPNNATVSDRRWKNRKETFEKAFNSKQNLISASNFGLEVRELFIDEIVNLANSSGFFSIWYAVFAGEKDVIEELIEAFPGTHRASFDEHNNFQPIPRLAGIM